MKKKNKRGGSQEFHFQTKDSGSRSVKYFEINTVSTLKHFYQKREFAAIILKKNNIDCLNDN